MNLLIRISSRIRHAAPRPRDFIPFNGNESLVVYQGRVFTDPEEFNAAWDMVNSPRFSAKGHTFAPFAVIAKEQPQPAISFTLEDNDVMLGDEKVGTLSDEGKLRMANGHGDIREEVENWLNTQNFNQP